MHMRALFGVSRNEEVRAAAQWFSSWETDRKGNESLLGNREIACSVTIVTLKSTIGDISFTKHTSLLPSKGVLHCRCCHKTVKSGEWTRRATVSRSQLLFLLYWVEEKKRSGCSRPGAIAPTLFPLHFLVWRSSPIPIKERGSICSTGMTLSNATVATQGVVTPMLPIDTLATGIKMFDRRNNALIPWFPF